MVITEELKREVWNKAQKIGGYDPNMYRKDACGAWIIWNKYGIKDNLYGWEIDHIYPQIRLKEKGFSDEEIWDIRNLRPLQHDNNRNKGDDYPAYTAAVTSEGNTNIYIEKGLVVNLAVRERIEKLYHLQ